MFKRILTTLALLPLPVIASTGLTIYQGNTALVREPLSLNLKSGENTVIHSPVPPGIDPSSILLLPQSPSDFQILEQAFESNTPTRDSLLRQFEGSELKFLVKENEKPDRIVTAKILVAAGDNSLVSLDDTIRFGLPGQPIFPEFTPGTRLQPSIVWTLASATTTSTKTATLAYLTSGLDWSADYTIVSRGDSESMDFTAMVTITNDSSRDFDNCTIKLMAGDVAVEQPGHHPREKNRMMAMAVMDSASPAVQERSFSDLHLYTLPRQVTLKPGEKKQVEFAKSATLTARKLYIYDPQADFVPIHFGGDRLQRLTNEEFGSRAGARIDVFREFKNTTENGLGIPLPAGTFRFYETDKEDIEFTGARAIGHTATGEKVRLSTGSAFDLVGNRKRTDLKIDTANKTTSEQVEITLRNRKDSDVSIQVIERLARGTNWEILQPSMKFERLDSNRIEFTVPVKAGATATITYTVRYSW